MSTRTAAATPRTAPALALVTGASTGFGAAIVRRFAAAGTRVIASARRADKLQALVAELGPERVVPLPLDVQDLPAVAATLAGLPADLTAIDVLVNNAGLALGLAPAFKADLSEWEQMINTNCLGLAAVTRAVLPGMVARNRGHIVNIGSIAGTYPYPGGNVYGATKAFVHQLSLNLRSDLFGTRVRVTCIEPGLAGGSEFSLVRFGGDAAKAAQVYAGTEPLLPEDIAACVEWVVNQPPHVNVNTVELMPTAQSFAPLQVSREPR